MYRGGGPRTGLGIIPKKYQFSECFPYVSARTVLVLFMPTLKRQNYQFGPIFINVIFLKIWPFFPIFFFYDFCKRFVFKLYVYSVRRTLKKSKFHKQVICLDLMPRNYAFWCGSSDHGAVCTRNRISCKPRVSHQCGNACPQLACFPASETALIAWKGFFSSMLHHVSFEMTSNVAWIDTLTTAEMLLSWMC